MKGDDDSDVRGFFEEPTWETLGASNHLPEEVMWKHDEGAEAPEDTLWEILLSSPNRTRQ